MPTIDLDALTIDDVRRGALDGRPVTVLGLARSGVALARFLHDAGARGDGLRRPAPPANSRRRSGSSAPATWRSGWDPTSTRLDVGRTRPWSRPRRRSPTTSRRPSRACAASSRRWSTRVLAVTPTRRQLVTEADLFLRLCPSPTIGVTGTKGKTTTSSLAHAILAADPIHPAVLGGNIGTPLVERLPGADVRPPRGDRALGAAAAEAVPRHHGRGLHERHLGPPRPPRQRSRRTGASSGAWPSWSTPTGALVLNLDDPVVGGYAGLGTAPAVLYRNERPVPGGLGVVDGWIVSAGVERLPLAGGGRGAERVRAGRSCRSRSWRSPARTTCPTRWPRSAWACSSAWRPTRSDARPAPSPAWSTASRPSAVLDGVRFVNDSQGTQPDAVIAALRAFPAPVVLIAGGRDKGNDLTRPRPRRRPSAPTPPC